MNKSATSYIWHILKPDILENKKESSTNYQIEK